MSFLYVEMSIRSKSKLLDSCCKIDVLLLMRSDKEPGTSVETCSVDVKKKRCGNISISQQAWIKPYLIKLRQRKASAYENIFIWASFLTLLSEMSLCSQVTVPEKQCFTAIMPIISSCGVSEADCWHSFLPWVRASSNHLSRIQSMLTLLLSGCRAW